MKKLNTLKFVFAVFMASPAFSQVKIAYTRIDDIVSYMPELAPEKVNLDTVGQKFVNDSIVPLVNSKQNLYNQKVQEYSAENNKLDAKAKSNLLAEIQDLQAYLTNSDQYIQQAKEQKQQEFFRPFYARAKAAIQQVAKEKGYTHVANTDIFLIAPEADDISLAVLDKLGIKIQNPKQSN
jgi:outer membrane protein